MTRVQLSRYEREQRQRKFIVYGAIATGLLVTGLIVAAAVQVGVVEPKRTVASVAGQPITVQNLQKRMLLTQSSVIGQASQMQSQLAQIQQAQGDSGAFLLQYYQQQFQQMVAQGSAQGIAQQAYSTMVDDLLIRDEAAKRGITIPADEVQQALEKSVGYYRLTPTPFPTTTPEPTIVVSGTAQAAPTNPPQLQPTSIPKENLDYEVGKRVANIAEIGYGEPDLRKFVEGDLVRTRLQESFLKDIPLESPHYQFDFIRFNAITDALKAADDLTAKKISFEALISQTNAITLPTSIGSGQKVDWISESRARDTYGAEVAGMLAYKALGAPTGVITTTGTSAYLVLPLGRETRPIAEGERTSINQKKFDEWLTAARENAALVKKDVDPASVIPAVVATTAADFQTRYAIAQPELPAQP